MANPYHYPAGHEKGGQFASKQSVQAAFFHLRNEAVKNNDYDAFEALSREYEEQFTAKHDKPLLFAEDTEPEKAVRYSFKEEFAHKVESFNDRFDGFPARFFNADLRGKILPSVERVPDLTQSSDSLKYFNHRALIQRLSASASAPSDAGLTPEALDSILLSLGAEEYAEITDETMLRAIGSEKAWVAQFYNDYGESKQIIITSDNQNSKNFNKYSFRRKFYTDAYNPQQNFMMIDTRTLVGLSRINNTTGTNLIPAAVGHDSAPAITVLATAAQMEDMQLEGRNFKEQQKYFREQASSVATAWMDKKNPKQSHIDAAKKSKLTKYFNKIELDNDVDLEDFRQFEADYAEVANLLPKVPADRKPTFRVRYLGKHKASGIFFAAKNTVAVDIRNSGSTIHELFHQYDIAVKNNASLSSEFREITRRYSAELKLPAELQNKSDYYRTPTEILARGGEVYAAEKLGIKNRLLNTSKLNDFDYAPFHQDPYLKMKLFDFFDNLYAEDSQQ